MVEWGGKLLKKVSGAAELRITYLLAYLPCLRKLIGKAFSWLKRSMESYKQERFL